MTRRQKRIYPQVFGVNRHFGHITQFRQHFNQSKAGVAHLFCIKRGNADQAVHAVFALERAIGIAADHFHRGALQAGFGAAVFVYHTRAVPFLFAKTQEHTQQHFRPVVGFGAAGSRMEGDNGVGRIMFTTEQDGEFQGGKLLFGCSQAGFYFGSECVITPLGQRH